MFIFHFYQKKKAWVYAIITGNFKLVRLTLNK